VTPSLTRSTMYVPGLLYCEIQASLNSELAEGLYSTNPLPLRLGGSTARRSLAFGKAIDFRTTT